MRHRVGCRVLDTYRGRLLPRVGILVLPIPLPIGEPGVAILNGSPCLIEWPGLPPSGKDQTERGIWATKRTWVQGGGFRSWVSAEHEGLHDLEEEEWEERMTGLLDRYATRKRKR